MSIGASVGHLSRKGSDMSEQVAKFAESATNAWGEMVSVWVHPSLKRVMISEDDPHHFESALLELDAYNARLVAEHLLAGARALGSNND
jgi:hypothetical protein